MFRHNLEKYKSKFWNADDLLHIFKFLEFHEEKYAKVQSGTSVEYVKMRENAQKKAFANF